MVAGLCYDRISEYLKLTSLISIPLDKQDIAETERSDLPIRNRRFAWQKEAVV
jgi:hypothetical protein